MYMRLLKSGFAEAKVQDANVFNRMHLYMDLLGKGRTSLIACSLASTRVSKKGLSEVQMSFDAPITCESASVNQENARKAETYRPGDPKESRDDREASVQEEDDAEEREEDA